MKAILDNFKKISDTEFHLKKNLQFARVSIDINGKVTNVDYEDKQNVEVGDLLSFNSTDYEITDINTDKYDILVVTVKKLDNPEQNVPDKSTYVPRKMSPRKPKPKKEPISQEITHIPDSVSETVKKYHSPVIKTETSQPIQELVTPKIKKSITPKPIEKKQSPLKRFAGWISSKLSTYSNS
mgnify:CR=1 FL=1|tara:strand:+ start:205 stop:750 length:546 start_codon:yes stop_codon:yes gene_type:complete